MGPRRIWDDAREKVDDEGACRVCGSPLNVEAAHVLGRKYDRPEDESSNVLYVHPDSIVPLCKEHHEAYDAHCFDLLSYLKDAEQIRAVEDTGSIETVRRRTFPSAYRDESVTPSPAYRREAA